MRPVRPDLLELPPLVGLSPRAAIDVEATRMLLTKVEHMPKNLLHRQLIMPTAEGANFSLLLLQRVLFHAWNTGEGAEEAELIRKVFQTIVERVGASSVILESERLSVFGLVAKKLQNHQFPKIPSPASSAPTASKNLGFLMIFASSVSRAEEAIKLQTDPGRLLKQVIEMESWNIAVPVSFRWTSDTSFLHDSTLNPSVLSATMNDESMATLGPLVAYERQRRLQQQFPVVTPSHSRHRL